MAAAWLALGWYTLESTPAPPLLGWYTLESTAASETFQKVFAQLSCLGGEARACLAHVG